MLQHAELDIDERAAAPVTLEAFGDLVEWYLDGDDERPGMSPPLCLGWDIHNKFGADGFAIWRDLMFAYESPLLAAELLPGDQRTAITTEQYEAALVEDWALFARDMHWTDWLIIDAMSRARHDGWVIAASETTILATEAILDDLALRSGAKRAAAVGQEHPCRRSPPSLPPFPPHHCLTSWCHRLTSLAGSCRPNMSSTGSCSDGISTQ
jgi:hypothetical protein